MRMKIIVTALIAMIPLSCGLKQFERVYKSTLTLDEAIAQKELIDATDNPARKFEITNDLSGKMIKVKDVVVKDVISASDIDYQFCVLSEVQTPKGIIEFYIFSKDLDTIAELEKGKTRIEVLGDFRRFFSLLDSSFVKIDIGDADITILK